MKYTDYSKNDLNIDKLREYVQTNIETKEDNSVKNYRVMCELIGEEILNGDSKKAQLNRWKRYFDFHKDGQKFVIDEIYDEPFATDDARKRKEGLYVKYIELLLLEYLSKQIDYKVTVGSKEMYMILGMTNENYSIRSKMKSVAANEVIRQTIAKNESRFVFTNPPVISDFNINNFYFRAEQKLNKILYSALNSMKNRFLIDYKKVNIIGELKSIEENGCNYLDYRESTAYEDKLILEAKKLIISQMGYNNVTEIMLCYKCEDFYNRFNEYIKENYGWERCYPQLRVVYIDDIAKQIPLKAEEIRKLSYDDKKSQLNAEIIKSLNIQAEKRYEENQNKVKSKCVGEWGDLNKMYDDEPFVYESDYVEIQRALADYLLNIHFEISDIKKKNPEERTVTTNESNTNLHSCRIPHSCRQCIRKHDYCGTGCPCANFFPDNMDIFLDYVITHLKENTPLSKEKKLKRHARNYSSIGLKYDDTTTLDEYYVRMINDVLSEIRRGKTDYLFNFEQIRDVLRFEKNITLRYVDGCYEIKIEK